MKKKFVLFVVLLSVVFAKDISELEQYAPFLAGKYRVIGQDIDTNATYSGVITLEYSHDKLIVKRVIDDKIQNGIAIIKKPFIESPKILEVSYTKSNQIVKTYYIWQTEFDNYARLTGRVVRDNKQVGYEALFAIKF